MAAVSVLALSACDWLAEGPSNGSYNRWESAAATTPAPPQTRVMQTADGTWLEPDRAAKPVPTAIEVAELKQANKRIADLEQEIASLRNDMNMMMPALTKLAGIQSSAVALSDIQPAAGGSIAAGEVTRIHRNYMQANDVEAENPEIGMDAPVNLPPLAQAPLSPKDMAQPPVAVVPPPPAPPATASAPPPAAAANASPVVAPAPAKAQPASYTPPAVDMKSVKGVRFGAHEGGKSRLVVDLSSESGFKYDIDNEERMLVIEIPATAWNAGPLTRMIQDNPLVQSMTASPDGQGGTRVVFMLQKPAKVLWSQAIPPAGMQGHRIVLDLAEI